MAEIPDPRVDEGLKVQAMLEFYKEQCVHGRHIEAQRHAVAAMFLGAAGILLSVVGALRFSLQSLPLALCIVGLGIFAKRFIARYAEKWDDLKRRRRQYREAIQGPLGIAGAERADDGKRGIRDYWRHTFTAVIVAGAICLALTATIAWVRTRPCGPGADGVALLEQLAGCGADTGANRAYPVGTR
jgi:hypothetical protein